MSNATTITGNLTREPEIRYTKEGQATTTLGVAVNRRWQDKSTQEWQESTSFFDVICWRDLAENVALSLSKGMRVVVTGRLEQRSWETDDGGHRSKVEIVADEIGASLRFATVDVRRTERRQDTQEAGSEASFGLRPADRAGSPARPGGPTRTPHGREKYRRTKGVAFGDSPAPRLRRGLVRVPAHARSRPESSARPCRRGRRARRRPSPNAYLEPRPTHPPTK